MSIDIVRGELERLFSLDELMALSSDLLGFDPKDIGGLASKASFARALTDRCIETDAIEALAFAIIASRSEIDPKVRELGLKGFVRPEELKTGDTFGPFTITKKIGESHRAIIYGATKAGAERTIKIFRKSACTDAAAVRRFLTYTRLLSRRASLAPARSTSTKQRASSEASSPGSARSTRRSSRTAPSSSKTS
jgi:hypothetical protein